MFEHVVKTDDKAYIIRRWRFGFEYWEQDDDVWWLNTNRWVTLFNSPEEAKESWGKAKAKRKVVKWL